MNEAEKEAREIILGDDHYAYCSHASMTYEKLCSCGKRIAQTLQKKQDEIEKLTARNEELEKLTRQCPRCLNWNLPESAHTCRVHDLVKKNKELEKGCCNCEYHLTEKANKRIEELESKLAVAMEALKVISNKMGMAINDSINLKDCVVTAKKALAELECGCKNGVRGKD